MNEERRKRSIEEEGTEIGIGRGGKIGRMGRKRRIGMRRGRWE